MPVYVCNIGIAILSALTFFFSILIGRKVFKTGIERFSSRILVLSGIINTTLCCLLFLFQGINEVCYIATSLSFSLGQLLIPLVFLVVPGRIVWNYFAIQRRLVARFNLKPHKADAFTTAITSRSRIMNISPPAILSSDLIVTPFIFGHRSSKAILAVPKGWQKIDDDRQNILLLHELGHIRNHDVGFLAWSNACIQDLRLLLILLPALIIYCYIVGYERIAPSISLYLACSLILYVLLRYVVRKRESLADITAAMLVESGKVRDAISKQEIYTIKPCRISEQQAEPKLIDKIQRWLTDRAIFSKKQKLWKLLLALFNFFHLLHPSRLDRMETIASVKSTARESSLSLGESFWAGISLGLMGVIIGLSGYWFEMFVLKLQDDKDILLLTYHIYSLTGPIAVGFLTVFLTLPMWSSLKLPILGKRFLFSLLTRFGIALVGACLVCPLVLFAGAKNYLILTLLVLCICWYIFVMFFGFAVSIVVVFIWMKVRYMQSNLVADLLRALWAMALFIAAIAAFLLLGIFLIYYEAGFAGVNLLFSAIAGCALTVISMKETRISETEQCLIFYAPFRNYRVEGKWFKPAVWIVSSLYNTVLLFLYTLLIYSSIYLAFSNIFRNLDSAWGILLLICICCVILIVLGYREKGRIWASKSHKIYSFCNCLKLLSEPIDSRCRKKVNKIAANYDLDTNNTKNRILNLAISDVYELVDLILEDTTQSKMLNYALAWVLRCQKQGGFGLWPGSSPRLYSTYQGISILQNVDLLSKCNTNQHISWIKALQQPDGSFKGPWSKRPAWEDTFYAVKALSMLGSSLDPGDTYLCRSWCSNIFVKKGIEKNKLDVIYYCFGSLDALGTIDEGILELVSGWLSSKMEELLLANISLDYENVHFTVMTYHLLDKHIKILEKPLNLLTERIKTALEAELADIRI